MKNNKKNKRKYVLLLLLFLLVSITVGYALLTATFNINGQSSIGANTWNVHFDQDSLHVTDGSETATSPVAFSESDPTTLTYTAPLTLPGDFYEFTVDVVNEGSVDAKLNEIVKPTLTADQEKYFNYKVTYADGSAIAQNDALAKTNGRATIKVRIEFDPAVTEVPATDVTHDALTLKLTYGQAK